MKLRLTYLAVFLIILSVLAFLPKTGGYIWQPEIINPLSALLFTLLVYLTGHIARSAQSAIGILCTAMFVLLFCPDSHEFFNRDETAVMSLSSTCIVPFFISQYTRISNKNFKYGYFLMLLMGIFLQLYARQHHDSALRQFPHTVLFAARPAVSPGLLAHGHRFCHRHHTLPLQSTFWKQSSWSDLTALSSQTADGFTQLWRPKCSCSPPCSPFISCLHGKNGNGYGASPASTSV